MSNGSLSVLNVGAGDIKIEFDKDDPLEEARARRIIEDMLNRGYALFVETDGKLKPVKRFNKNKNCYVIADGPLYRGDPASERANHDDTEAKPKIETRRRKKAEKEVPLKKAKAIGVAPTAGG